MRALMIGELKSAVRILHRGLGKTEITVDTATDGNVGEHMALRGNYDVIVFNAPTSVAFAPAALRQWRQGGVAASILLLLPASATVQDRVGVLNAGADDYLAHPFAWEELLARLRALVRRRSRTPDSVIRVRDLEIDTSVRSVQRGGKPIFLT